MERTTAVCSTEAASERRSFREGYSKDKQLQYKLNDSISDIMLITENISIPSLLFVNTQICFYTEALKMKWIVPICNIKIVWKVGL